VINESEIVPLVESLAAALAVKGWRIATAESCTGGWIAKCCTDRAGSSEWFERGYVTYSNEAKIDMLGVSPETLKLHHAVSVAVAREMAEGARRHSGAEVARSDRHCRSDGGSEKPGNGMLAWSGWADMGVSAFSFRAIVPVRQFSSARARAHHLA
jgi:nicotinamide-nucleotide amidase